jgi:ABC-2 type transport system ATP-binding protein
MSTIVAQSLTKRYGPRLALDDFSLTVPEGCIFGLLGPNGAGKTTAIEIMLGLRNSDSGNVDVLGDDPSRHFSRIAPKIGAMLQQGGINPGLKPREALQLYSAFYPKSLDVDELLVRVDLEGVDTNVRRLSGGQAQSLSLAIAIIGCPTLVFLDEPTVGMDPRARRRTWDVIKGLKDGGATVVLTTHLMDEAEMLCDEIAIVAHGKVIAQGDTKSLTQSKQEIIDLECAENFDASIFTQPLECEGEQVTESSIRIRRTSEPALLVNITQIAVENNLHITTLSSNSRNLEDVFLELTSHEYSETLDEES